MEASDPVKNYFGEHAIIIGGSIGGLTAAQVLAKYFKKITIIEADPLPSMQSGVYSFRPGAPQGAHAHALTSTGLKILKKLFPTLESALITNGACKVDILKDMRLYEAGSWKPRIKSELYAYVQSRPLLEETLRSLLNEHSNIVFLYESEVKGLLEDPKIKRITGVRIINKNTQEEYNQYSDLVVDASGRLTACPDWLQELGYKKPEVEQDNVGIHYITKLYRLPEGYTPDWKCIHSGLNAPEKKELTIVQLEKDTIGERYIVTLSEQHGNSTVNTDEEFLAFLHQLKQLDTYDILKEATPITPIVHFKYPFTRWRHYEKIASQLPLGFIAMGDAVCSVNPVYGQGMTLASNAALVLSKVMSDSNEKNYLDNLKNNYFKQLSKIIAPPWIMNKYQDYLFTEAGKPPFGINIVNWYTKLILKKSNDNPKLLQLFAEVAQLEKPPLAFIYPSTLLQLIWKH